MRIHYDKTDVIVKGNIVKNNEPFLESKSLSDELWREYDFGSRVYRIDNPKTLYMRYGGTTHRVVDDKNVVHCVPAPGQQGCVLRWKSRDESKPVSF